MPRYGLLGTIDSRPAEVPLRHNGRGFLEFGEGPFVFAEINEAPAEDVVRWRVFWADDKYFFQMRRGAAQVARLVGLQSLPWLLDCFARHAQYIYG